jgi:nitrite reductase (NO-forming)
MKKFSALLVIVLGGALLALPAVGTAANTTSMSTSSIVKLTALASGLKFNTKVLHARAGKIKVVFTNLSTLHHNVRIESGENELGGTKTIGKGTAIAYVTLKKGSYNFYCSVPGHEDAGMHGTLIVS